MSQLDNVDLTESTLTTNDYMWKTSSCFQGSWLDIEAINRWVIIIKLMVQMYKMFNMHCDVLVTMRRA
jgi:hypothetical protein